MTLQDADSPPTGRRRQGCFRLLAAALVAVTCLAILEGFVRVFPATLPVWYRSTFPLRGIELFEPGVLAATPIDGVPLPYRFDSRGDYRGGPPVGLQALGLLTAEQNPDFERYPDIHFHFDRWGLANPEDIDSADVLMVGDSFVHAAGALSPPGLQANLQRATGLTLFNLGLPSIGPQREAWLLENLGFAQKPKAVIWFFFGGNDLEDAKAVARHQSQGVETYADLFPGISQPRSLLLDLVRKTTARSGKPAKPGKPTKPMPSLSFAAHDGNRSLWFHPHYLRELARTPEQLAADPGWRITTEVLEKVAASLARRSIRLLVVYVPSKPEVYLPWVEEDQALVHRMASFGSPIAAVGSAEDFWRLATENRGQLERLLGRFCDARGITYLSLTEPLTDLARRGELGYFAADTHWNDLGQNAAVEPLARWLRPGG